MAILTISRQYGSGGREIGLAAANLLGYEYIDRARMLADIRTAGKNWEQWAKELDEHCPSVWEKYDWSFRGFAALVQKVILEHALQGNVVIMGRGGNFLLAGIPHAFRIRVEAPADVRTERVTKREGVDRETARWLCEKTDSERSCFLQTVYGKPWDDPSGYDRVFDAGKQTIEEIVAIVSGALKERAGLATDEAVKRLKMRALAARVKAGIATNPRFFVPTLDVFDEGDSIVLRGVTHSPREHKTIEEAAHALSEGLPLRCELHYRK